MTFAVLVYLSGALAIRVMWERGRISEGSLTYRAVLFIYRPLEHLSASSPTFSQAFKACVDVLVPENKDGDYAAGSGRSPER